MQSAECGIEFAAGGLARFERSIMYKLRGLFSLLMLLGLGLSVSSAQQSPTTFRVMTYNIHHGEGVDGKLDLKRIASLIQQEKADLVALQEVDRGATRLSALWPASVRVGGAGASRWRGTPQRQRLAPAGATRG